MMQLILILTISHMTALLVPGASLVMILGSEKNKDNKYELILGYGLAMILHLIIGFYFYSIIAESFSVFNIFSGLIIFYIGLGMLDLNPINNIFNQANKSKSKNKNTVNNSIFKGFLIHFSNIQAFAFVTSLMLPIFSEGFGISVFGGLILVLQVIGYYSIISLTLNKIGKVKAVLQSETFSKCAGVVLIMIGTTFIF